MFVGCRNVCVVRGSKWSNMQFFYIGMYGILTERVSHRKAADSPPWPAVGELESHIFTKGDGCSYFILNFKLILGES